MIEIKGLSKSFDKKLILDHVNLFVNKGEVLAIVGPSGGGKTTLLRCISGIEPIDSGEIWVDGEKIHPGNHHHNKGMIGVVFQDFNLFPHLTVLENLILAPTLVHKKDRFKIEQEAKSILADFGLEDKHFQYPNELSGGQKQRVALARALLMTPKVLCYDEPTSALDPDLRDNVADIILNVKKQGMTQIVVTHDHEFAQKISDQLLEVKPII